MKACLLQSFARVETNPLAYVDVPTPQPGQGEVLVRVQCCGVCRTDLHVIEGELAPRKLPVIPGHQVVGVVQAFGGTGAKYSRLAAGTGRAASRFRNRRSAGRKEKKTRTAPGGSGKRAAKLAIGSRVGVAWLHCTDGTCEYCRSGKENLCDNPGFTGYTVNGGYAEYIVAREDFVYPIPERFADEQAAPLLCAGIIGFRSLRLSGIKRGAKLGFYGFGAAAHVAIQVALHWNAEVYAMTRDVRHQKLAMELGAKWAGGTFDVPPQQLDAAIVFAPAGEIIPAALKALRKGGVLVLGGIHMSPIPSFDYDLLYQERVIRSVANNTRQDGRDFLRIAAEIPIRTHVQIFPLRDANRALNALKNDAIEGAAVLKVAGYVPPIV
jgi:alcohol dehydrogenase, propanol-preferring